MSARLVRIASLSSLALVAVVILLLPSTAHAWAPLAHLSFSAEALTRVGTVPLATRSLLSGFANEFLYGSLAADIVVGKNLARFAYHCHNWRVAFNVQRAARSDPERAFALGFLAHLAADTVAHNYFVPYEKVVSFHRHRTRHAYWELRYDQRMDRSLARVARVVTGPDYRAHDALLRRSLQGASVLPFSLSRGLFGSVLVSARHPRFQALSRVALARHRDLPLDDDLIADTRRLAVEAILDVLRDGERSRTARVDATGARNLRLALQLRRGLARRRRPLPLGTAQEVRVAAREAFRRGIHGKLVLPPVLARLAA